MGENPSTSLAWEEHAIQWAAALPGFETADFDWCRYAQRRPDAGLLVKKPTRLVGNAPVPSQLSRRCTRDHPHSALVGTVPLDGRKVNATEWAGGYNRTFARAAVKCMHSWLCAHVSLAAATVVAYPVDEDADDPQVDEQAFEQPEAYDCDPEAAAPGSAESWSASELPESKR